MITKLTEEAEAIMKDVVLDLYNKGMTKDQIKTHVRADVVDKVFVDLGEITKKSWIPIPFFSDEYRDYGTLTKSDVDIILNDHSFVERCKKDGILTYERDCNALKKIQLPFNALIELLESMPTEQTMWTSTVVELKKMQVLLKEIK